MDISRTFQNVQGRVYLGWKESICEAKLFYLKDKCLTASASYANLKEISKMFVYILDEVLFREGIIDALFKFYFIVSVV